MISIDAENTTDKIQHPFPVKTFWEIGKESNFLNMRKNYYKNT